MASSSKQSSLTVCVSTGGRVEAVAAALADLHALGLLEDFVHLSPQRLTDNSYLCRLCTADGWRTDPLPRVIAELRPRLIRLLLISEVSSPVEASTAQATQQLSEQLMVQSGARVVRVHVMLTRPGDSARPSAREGWHNILLSPEDSFSPGASQVPPPEVGLGQGYARHETWSVAVLGGLLKGQEEAPLDQEALLPGSPVRLARSYVRNIDAEALETKVRHEVLSMDRGYPLPKENGVSATYIENTSKACAEAADALWASSEGRFTGPRRKPRAGQSERITAGRALVMFFSFLLAAITGAPAAWARGKLQSAKLQLAERVQDFVFGPAGSSRYAVTVGGVSAERRRSTRDLLEGLRAQSSVLGSYEEEHRDHQDFADIWRSLVAGTLTLLDGMQRSVFSPVRIGDRVAIARHGEDVTGRTDTFHVQDSNIARFLSTDTLEGPAFNEAYQMLSTLSALKQDTTYARAASDVERDLTEWLRPHQNTFVGHFIERLAQALQGRLTELDACIEVLKTAAGDDDGGAELGRAQRRLSRRLLLIGAVGLMLLLCLVGLYLFAVITLLVMVVGIVVVVLGHLVASFATFLRGQREFFRLLHAREAAVSAAEAASSNLPVIVRESVMLGDVYELAVRWARVISCFADNPLASSTTQAEPRPTMQTELPLSITLGEARSDEQSVATTAHALRSRIFQRGWLDTAWHGFLGGAKQQLGTAGVALSDDAEALYHQRAAVEDDLLDRWIEILNAHGGLPVAADAAWGAALRQLHDPQQFPPASLITEIELDGHRGLQRYDDAVAPWQDGSWQSFVAGNLRGEAVGKGMNRISQSWSTGGRAGLGLLQARMDLSDGIPTYYFGESAEPSPSARSTEPPPSPFSGPSADLTF